MSALHTPDHPERPTHSLTQRLARWRAGEGAAFDAAIAICMDQLQQMAVQRLRREGEITLSAHELLNEAVIRVMEADVSYANRAHFLATMSLHMRAALVDHARQRRAAKRGWGQVHLSLTGTAAQSAMADATLGFELIALDETLNLLESRDPKTAQVIHLTYFSGLERAEIAEVIGVSVATVDRALRFGRAWLSDQLGHELP